MEGLTPTRMVHYVATGNEPYVRDSARGHCKAAVVVAITPGGEDEHQLNLHCMWDGYNDLKLGVGSELPPMTTWLHSVSYQHTENGDRESLSGTWHWPRECTLDH